MSTFPIRPARLTSRGPARGPHGLAVQVVRLVVLQALLTSALLAFVSSPVAADEAAPPAISEAERDRRAEAISRSIMSPFCPGRTVSSCPNAAPWRADIRTWVGEGVDSEEIKRRLAARVP